MYNECLLKVPIFSDLTEAELIEVTQLITPQHYQANEIIYHEGDRIKTLGVIHGGSVKLSKINPEGKERIVSILFSGDYFGETSLISSRQSEYDIVALEASHVCTIDLHAFRDLMHANQTLTLSMLDSIIHRLAEQEQSLVSQSLKSAPDRIYETLAHYSDAEGLVTLPLTHHSLSHSLGIAPETFSRSLTTLEKQAKIVRQGNTIILVK